MCDVAWTWNLASLSFFVLESRCEIDELELYVVPHW